MKKRAELQSIADATRAAASSRRKAAEVAAMATLEANVASLLADREQDHALLTEQQGEISALRLAVGELRRDVGNARDLIERHGRELKTQALEPIDTVRGELQSALGEVAALKAQVSVLTSQLTSMQQSHNDHSLQLKDVGALKAQHTFVQAASDRAELVSAEQMRLLSEVRSELAGLQQRHASLANSSNAEQNAQRTAQTALRSTVETAVMQLEGMAGEVSGIKAAEAASGDSCDKLKKAAKRHELLLQRVSEVHEQRASELRALIKTLADQMRPLHETSRRHAAQLEEMSSGINVLAELLRFSNRNRTQTLADALGAV